MDDIYRDLVYKNLNLRETEDLIEIWREKNIDEYQEEVFDIIKDILLERLGYLPPQSNRTQIEQRLNQIEELLEAGDLEEALRACDTLIGLAPDTAAAFHYRGAVHDAMGGLAKAILDYRKAVQLDPELEGAWEDFLSAEEDMEAEFQGSDSKRHLDNALSFAYDGEPEHALAEIDLANKTMPAIAAAYNDLGQVFVALDRWESAIEAYLIAVQLNPRYYDAWENLANARVVLEEERYLKMASATPEAFPEYGVPEPMQLAGEGAPVPGWFYLDDKGFLLPGWPGHRTRPGRSGYDPLDSDFEFAQMEGRILRMLFTNSLRTHNPFYLLLMTMVGFLYCIPMILTLMAVFNGEIRYLGFVLVYGFHSLFGMTLFVNVLTSFQSGPEDADGEDGSAFF